MRLLLDKHKNLKLGKDQVTALHALDATLVHRTDRIYERVDSLHKTFKAPSGGFQRSTGSDGGRGNMMENRQAFYETLLQLRTNNKTARDSALALSRNRKRKGVRPAGEAARRERQDAPRAGPRGGMSSGRRGQPPG